MKNIKKMMSAVTVFAYAIIMISLANLNAFSETGTYGVFTYETVDENRDGIADSITITGCDKTATSIEIPTEINGIPVTTIGRAAFYQAAITSLTIPEGITTLEEMAFYHCQSLTSISIPSTVEVIPEWCFAWCTSIQSLTIPETVKSIEPYAFYHLEAITELVIPKNITVISEYAFAGELGLLTLSLPDTLTKISDNGFYACKSIETVTIPYNVKSIGSGAFEHNEMLTTVIIENPECAIYNGEYATNVFANINTGRDVFHGTIYGYDGSTAQAYAAQCGRDYASLGTAPVFGDLHTDGTINLYDAVEVSKTILGMRKLVDSEKPLGDYNRDGYVDLYDAISIALYIM